jgi:putative transposase
MMQRNDYGEIVADEWQRSVIIRPGEIELGAWIVMPNHFHAIVTIPSHPTTNPSVGTYRIRPTRSSIPNQLTPTRQPKSLSTIIGGFKATVTRRINQTRQTPQSPVWQRNYYENIIRSTTAFQTIQTYIHNNPNQWELDQLHPQNPSKW